MAVGADGAAVGVEPGGGGRVRSGPERRRRWVTRRGVLASAAALVLAPLVGASRASGTADESESPAGPQEPAFDEVYRGRHIQGRPVAAGVCGPEGCAWQVSVDGHPLHLMRRADGTWLTMVDHYSSYGTSLAATRAAVDELGPGQRLRDLAPGPIGHGYGHMGDHRGVRA
ncbi:tyrosinase family oxidase copper chaperone [Streptomyces sp. NPDC050788]|uniref:tyrosinase family oxidase copper chaperone n=1 Tax=Streptomyces sp. NPDC050788 TaxID=3155041 RepID=UPI00343579AD